MRNLVFISYSGNRTERAALPVALREHGIRPWRDVEDLPHGEPSREEIQDAMRKCSGVILWLSEDAIDSDYVCNIEAPLIGQALNDRGVLVMPIFDGLGPTEALTAFRDATGLELTEQNGHTLDPTVRPEIEAATIAAHYVRAHLNRLHPGDEPSTVRAVTRDDTADLHDEADLNFDWRDHFTDGSFPDDETLDRLAGALRTSMRHLKHAADPGLVRVAAKIHLPFAVALGHTLRRPTGFLPVMRHDETDWQPDPGSSATEPLVRSEYPGGDARATRSALEVSVTRDVAAKVRETIRARGLSFRRRVVLQPADGPSQTAVDGSPTASACAQQIRDEIGALNTDAGVSSVDLFYAGPIELAIMVGWWLNAAGTVTVHQLAGNQHLYRPMWSTPDV